MSNQNIKSTETLHNLRKNKKVNYLENTLNTSNTPIPIKPSEKLPIYKQQLEKRTEEKDDLYEFDSDSEKVSKSRKRPLDDPSFVLNIKSKRVRKRKNKLVNLKDKMILNNNKFSQKSTTNELISRNNEQREKNINKIQSAVNKKLNLQYTSVTLQPVVASTPNNTSQNHNVLRVPSDKVFNNLLETSDKCTNLSIVGRRPKASSTLIHWEPKAKRMSTEHIIIEDEFDNWSDEVPSISPDRDVMIESKFSFVENIIPGANSTMIAPKLFSTPKRSKSVATGKENMSPNVTFRIKMKKQRKIMEDSKPEKNKKLSHIDLQIAQTQHTIIEKAPSIDTNTENVQDNESSDDDDDDWLNFDTSQKTNNNHKPTNGLKPWRFNHVNVNRTPLFLTLKETAMPSINQELVVNHSIANNISPKKTNIQENGKEDPFNDQEIKLFEDIVEPVSDEEVEALDVTFFLCVSYFLFIHIF